MATFLSKCFIALSIFFGSQSCQDGRLELHTYRQFFGMTTAVLSSLKHSDEQRQLVYCEAPTDTQKALSLSEVWIYQSVSQALPLIGNRDQRSDFCGQRVVKRSITSRNWPTVSKVTEHPRHPTLYKSMMASCMTLYKTTIASCMLNATRVYDGIPHTVFVTRAHFKSSSPRSWTIRSFFY